MTLAFYMDVHVPGSITNGLRLRSIDILTAQEDGFDDAPDDELLNRATAMGRVLVTYDHDFLIETHERQLAGINFAGIIFSHQEQVELGRWIDEMELIAVCFKPDEIRNRVEYLPLK